MFRFLKTGGVKDLHDDTVGDKKAAGRENAAPVDAPRKAVRLTSGENALRRGGQAGGTDAVRCAQGKHNTFFFPLGRSGDSIFRVLHASIQIRAQIPGESKAPPAEIAVGARSEAEVFRHGPVAAVVPGPSSRAAEI